MKTENVIWGLVLVFIGGILLLDNFDLIDFYWRSVWRLWPLIIIISGANMIFAGSKTKGGSFAAIIITVVALGFITYFGIRENQVDSRWSSDSDTNDEEAKSSWSSTNTFTEPFDSNISRATLNISGGATVYYLNDTSANLFDADVKNNFGNYSLNRISQDSMQVINFQMNNRKRNWEMDGKEGNEAKIRINSRPVWDINIQTGAGKTEFDLSRFKVKNLHFKGGAASFEAKLGEPQQVTYVSAETGVAEIKLSVPRTAGCRIKVNSGLSSKDFDGFTQQADGSYITENYRNSDKKVEISLKGGLSDFDVNRY